MQTPSSKSQSGQATLEYILLLILVLVTVLTIAGIIAGARNGIWATMTCEIISPCPKCPVEGPRAQTIKAAATQAGGDCK